MPRKTLPNSLKTLLDGLIDYAGLFPPASLSLDASVRNYVRYRRESDRWMLAAFVCPASRLAELERHDALLGQQGGHTVSALGPAAENLRQWREGLSETLRAVLQFNGVLGDHAHVSALELKIPRTVVERPDSLAEAVSALADAVGSEISQSVEVFVEIVPAAEDVTAIRLLADRLLDCGLQRPALKIRTGGVTANSIPPPGQIARFVLSCRDADIPFKATAGLHHPLYHRSHSVGAYMHGFLNVFVGALVAAEHGLPESELERILTERDAGVFVFSDDCPACRHMKVPTSRLSELRARWARSFGSCSFDEPRQDLRDLGLL